MPDWLLFAVQCLAYLAMTGYPCCCSAVTVTTCVNCVDDEAGTTLKVVVFDIADDTCTDCTTLNGTYPCDWTANCYYQWGPTTSLQTRCFASAPNYDSVAVYAVIGAGGSGYDVAIQLAVNYAGAAGSPGDVQYYKTWAAKPDCLAWSSETINYDSEPNDFGCDTATSYTEITFTA